MKTNTKLKHIVQFIRDAANKKIGIAVAVPNVDSPTGYSYGYAIHRPSEAYDEKEGYDTAFKRCITGEPSPVIKGDRMIYVYASIQRLAVRAHRYFKTTPYQAAADENYPSNIVGSVYSATDLLKSVIELRSFSDDSLAIAKCVDFDPDAGLITYKICDA